MHHPMYHDTHQPRPLRSPGALVLLVLCLSACGGSDVGPAPNFPLTTPMALIINQDDTTMTTLRLDGTLSPVVGTLSLGPAEPDAIGGVSFSLGEWIFVTHTAGNRVAFIDPIGAVAPILEDFLITTTDPRVGLKPKRIYRDPADKEVLWTMNEGEDDTCTGRTSTVSVLHNSHIAVGGDKPHIKKTSCLYGKGEQFAAFSMPIGTSPALRQTAFVSNRTTGLITTLTADSADGANKWSTLVPVLLCDGAKEQALGFGACGSPLAPNHAEPAGMFWSQATGKIYSYLAGYRTVVEIDPDRSRLVKTREAVLTNLPPSPTLSHVVGMTPNGRALLVIVEDRSDSNHVVTRFASIDLTVPTLAVTDIPFPQLQDVRIGQFQFTPDGRQLFLLASNDNGGLTPAQVANQRKDVLFVFDPSTIPLVAEMALPAATSHAMDLWITGPAGAGSAKGIVVTNATPGVNGTVSLIDAASRMITATFPVGRNPKMVTVYYAGLAASDNQAMPRW